jgi:hypothetical protein
MATQPYAVAGSNLHHVHERYLAVLPKHYGPQEQIAHLSRGTVCTIQRLEAGQPSSLDTRRAVAGHNRLPRVPPSSKIVVSKRVKMGW